jgi:UDP-glucose 4-epimerase
MPRVLVTGGSGFIGQHLVSELVARGRQVRILDVRPPTRTLSAAERRELGYVPRPVEPLLQEIIAHMVGASAGEVLKHA